MILFSGETVQTVWIRLSLPGRPASPGGPVGPLSPGGPEGPWSPESHMSFIRLD